MDFGLLVVVLASLIAGGLVYFVAGRATRQRLEGDVVFTEKENPEGGRDLTLKLSEETTASDIPPDDITVDQAVNEIVEDYEGRARQREITQMRINGLRLSVKSWEGLMERDKDFPAGYEQAKAQRDAQQAELDAAEAEYRRLIGAE